VIIRDGLLFELHAGASFFQLGLDTVGLFLGSTLLDSIGSTVNQVLGLFQAQTGDGTHNFDDVDFLFTYSGEDDVKLILLFDSGGIATGGRASSSNSKAPCRPRRIVVGISLPSEWLD